MSLEVTVVSSLNPSQHVEVES